MRYVESASSVKVETYFNHYFISETLYEKFPKNGISLVIQRRNGQKAPSGARSVIGIQEGNSIVGQTQASKRTGRIYTGIISHNSTQRPIPGHCIATNASVRSLDNGINLQRRRFPYHPRPRETASLRDIGAITGTG